MCKAIEDMRTEARDEGIMLGKTEGIIQGKAEGKIEGSIIAAVSVAMDFGKTREEAIEYVSYKFGKTPQEIKKYLRKS